jgi:hypothetical protein
MWGFRPRYAQWAESDCDVESGELRGALEGRRYISRLHGW